MSGGLAYDAIISVRATCVGCIDLDDCGSRSIGERYLHRFARFESSLSPPIVLVDVNGRDSILILVQSCVGRCIRSGRGNGCIGHQVETVKTPLASQLIVKSPESDDSSPSKSTSVNSVEVDAVPVS